MHFNIANLTAEPCMFKTKAKGLRRVRIYIIVQSFYGHWPSYCILLSLEWQHFGISCYFLCWFSKPPSLLAVQGNNRHGNLEYTNAGSCTDFWEKTRTFFRVALCVSRGWGDSAKNRNTCSSSTQLAGCISAFQFGIGEEKLAKLVLQRLLKLDGDAAN